MVERVFSLLSEPWLPVRQSGERRWIAPHQIVDGIDTDPVVAPDWGRADFDAATLEFLIGLLATAFAPAGVDEWADLFETPPSADRLAEASAPFADAFRLDGPGPRFMQDLADLAVEPTPVSGLFIEAPGANTEKKNADLFQKRGRLAPLGLPAAAMALFTLQSYAPSGGAGHRTSLRGGGPLTTLAVPPESHGTLWHRLWLNVPLREPSPLPTDRSRIFAWLGPTRTSEGKAPPIGADDVHPLAVFWGMPRRIRLDIRADAEPAVCAVTGLPAPVSVSTYRTRPWGMNYLPIRHPLSPMYRTKASTEWLFVHPQPGGLSYRHWIDIALTQGGDNESLRQAAPSILTARERLQSQRLGVGRLWAAGYDMDNMKARGFTEATFPLFALADRYASNRLDDAARTLAGAATDVASWTAGAVGDALNIEAGDASRLGGLRESFFAETQEAFFQALRRLGELLTADPESGEALAQVTRPFLEETLRPAAFATFDREAPLLAFGASEAQRIIQARLGLASSLRGYGKRGQELFKALVLPLPETRAGRKAAQTA